MSWLQTLLLCYLGIVAHASRVDQDDEGLPRALQHLVDKVAGTSVDKIFERVVNDASMEFDFARFQQLLTDGANPNYQRDDRRTPLTALLDAARKHYRSKGSLLLSALKVLLKHGADPNVKDQKGNLPLQVCSSSMSLEAWELVHAGAEVSASEYPGLEYQLRDWLPAFLQKGSWEEIEVLITVFIQNSWELNPEDKNLNYILLLAVQEKAWPAALQMVLWGANPLAKFWGRHDQTARSELLRLRREDRDPMVKDLLHWTGPFGQRKIRDRIKQERMSDKFRSWLQEGRLWAIQSELKSDASLQCPLEVRDEVFRRFSCRTMQYSELWGLVGFLGINPALLQDRKCKGLGPWDWDALIAETKAKKHAEDVRKTEEQARQKAEQERRAREIAQMLEQQAQQAASNSKIPDQNLDELERDQITVTEAGSMDSESADALSSAVRDQNYSGVEMLLCKQKNLVPKSTDETLLIEAYDDGARDPALRCALEILETAVGEPMPAGCCKTAGENSGSSKPSGATRSLTIAEKCAKVHRATPRAGWHPVSSAQCKCYAGWELSTQCGTLSGRRKFDVSNAVFQNRDCHCVKIVEVDEDWDEEEDEEWADKLHEEIAREEWVAVEALLCLPWIRPSPCSPRKCPSLNPTSDDEYALIGAWEDGERNPGLKCAIQAIETPPGRPVNRNGCCGKRVQDLINSE
eukprot:TRINITY_DN32226_c0_g1_i1.p1 TRINITY_DN32226_c0_g1~~TRINITY_DN32226_c0_g1_i1.p1  ORF type:complete len:692 (+),score=129.18 TRINITY_DN32226_c0_g1_i1:266-2341(+)